MFEYLSNGWLDSDGTPTDVIKTDGDTVVFNDDMMEKQLVWRLKQSRGLPFSVELAIAEDNTRLFGTDAGT